MNRRTFELISVVLIACVVAAAQSQGSSLLTGQAAFGGYPSEKPGVFRKITGADLPQPYATKSVDNGAEIVSRPKDAWPQAPPGFRVQLYADNLHNPRLIRTAPNGDVFVAESYAGDVKVLRGTTADGKAAQSSIFASGLDKPFGIAFYPPGPDPQWVYVGDTGAVVRFPYRRWRSEGARCKAENLRSARRRPASRRGTLDPRRCVLARRKEDVRFGRFPF